MSYLSSNNKPINNNQSPFKGTPPLHASHPYHQANNQPLSSNNSSFGGNSSNHSSHQQLHQNNNNNGSTMSNSNNNNNNNSSSVVNLSGKALEHWLSLQKRATHQTPIGGGSKKNSRTNSPSPSPRNPLVPNKSPQVGSPPQNLFVPGENNISSHVDPYNNQNNSNNNNNHLFDTLNNNNDQQQDVPLPPHLSPSLAGDAILLSEGRKRDLARLRRLQQQQREECQQAEEERRNLVMKDAFGANFVDLLFALSSFQRMETLLCKSTLTPEQEKELKNKSRNDEEREIILNNEILTKFISSSYHPSMKDTTLSVPFIFRRIMEMTSELEEDMKTKIIRQKETTKNIAVQADTITGDRQLADLQLIEENYRLKGQLDFVMNFTLPQSTAFFRVLVENYSEELEEASELLEQTMKDLEDESKKRMALEMDQLAMSRKSAYATKLAEETQALLEEEKLSAEAARKARDEMAAQLNEAFDEVDSQTMSKAQLATQAARDKMKAASKQSVTTDKTTQTQIGIIVAGFQTSSTSTNNGKKSSINNGNNNNKKQKNQQQQQKSSSLVVGPRNPRDCGEIFLNTQTVPGASEISIFFAPAECFMRGGYHYRQGAVEINLAKGTVQHFADYTEVQEYRFKQQQQQQQLFEASFSQQQASPSSHQQNQLISPGRTEVDEQQQLKEPHPNVSVKISTIAAVDRLPFVSYATKTPQNALRLLLTQDHSHIDFVLNNRRDAECVFEALALARSTFVSRCFVQRPWGDSAPKGTNVMPGTSMKEEQSLKVDQSMAHPNTVVMMSSPLQQPSTAAASPMKRDGTNNNNKNNNQLEQQQDQQNNTTTNNNNTNANAKLKRIHTRTNAMEYDYRVRLITTRTINSLLAFEASLNSTTTTNYAASPFASLSSSSPSSARRDQLQLASSPSTFFGSATFSPEMNSKTSLAQGSGSLFLTLQRMHQCRIAWVGANDILSGVLSDRELFEISRTSNILVMWRQVQHSKKNNPPLLTSFLNFGGSSSGDAKSKSSSYFAKWGIVVSASSSSAARGTDNNQLVATTQLLIAATRESLPWIGSYSSSRQRFCSQLSLSLFVLGSKLTFVSCDFEQYPHQQNAAARNNNNKGLGLLQNEVFCSGSEAVFFLCNRGQDMDYIQENPEEIILGGNNNNKSLSSSSSLSFVRIPNEDYDDGDEDDDDDEGQNNNNEQQLLDDSSSQQTPIKNNNKPSPLNMLSFLSNKNTNDSFANNNSLASKTKIAKNQPTLAVLMCSHSFLPNYSGTTIWRPSSVRDPTATELADGMIKRAAHSTLVPIRRVPCTILGQQQQYQQLVQNVESENGSIKIKSLKVRLFNDVLNSNVGDNNNNTINENEIMKSFTSSSALSCALTAPCLEDSWFSIENLKPSSTSTFEFSIVANNKKQYIQHYVNIISSDRTRLSSEVITVKIIQQQQNKNNTDNNSSTPGSPSSGATTKKRTVTATTNTDSTSSRIIFGFFSLLSAKGWTPGSGEVVSCTLKLFKFPKRKDDDENNSNSSDDDKNNNSANNHQKIIRDPSSDDSSSSDDEEQKEKEEDAAFAECVGECDIQLVV